VFELPRGEVGGVDALTVFSTPLTHWVSYILYTYDLHHNFVWSPTVEKFNLQLTFHSSNTVGNGYYTKYNMKYIFILSQLKSQLFMRVLSMLVNLFFCGTEGVFIRQMAREMMDGLTRIITQRPRAKLSRRVFCARLSTPPSVTSNSS